MNRLGDASAFVIPAGQLLLTRLGTTRMYTVGIVFEFYTVPLHHSFTVCPNFSCHVSIVFFFFSMLCRAAFNAAYSHSAVVFSCFQTREGFVGVVRSLPRFPFRTGMSVSH